MSAIYLTDLSHADLLLYVVEAEKRRAEVKAEEKELHDLLLYVVEAEKRRAEIKSVVREEDWEEDIVEVVENLVGKIDVLEELLAETGAEFSEDEDGEVYAK